MFGNPIVGALGLNMGNPIVGIAAAFAPFGGTPTPPNVVVPAGVVVVVVVVVKAACGGRRPERSPPVDATVFTPAADLFATIVVLDETKAEERE